MKKEIKKVPTMRFKGFMDDWEQRKVGDFLIISKILGHTGIDAKKLTVKLWGKGIVEKTDVFSGSENTQYFVRHAGQFMYGKLDFLHAAFGIVPENLDNYESTLDLPAFDLQGIDGQFLLERVTQEDFYLRNGIIANGSRKAKRIHEETFLNMDLMIPSYKEQAQIGNFFRRMNNRITLHQRKLDQLQTLKKYFLQNMFPAKEEKVPAIRFKGFTGDWEQCKFGEMANYKKGPFGSALKKDMFVPDSDDSVKVYEQQNVIHKNWQLERYYITADYAYTLRAFKVHGGDILVSCAGTIGEIYELPQKARPGIINQALMRVRVNNNIVHKNMYKLLFANMIEKFSQERSNGSAMKNIPPFADLKSIQALIPSIKEQEKTGQYFATLDNLITLHQRKCNQLQALKKFMLQNLFIQRK